MPSWIRIRIRNLNAEVNIAQMLTSGQGYADKIVFSAHADICLLCSVQIEIIPQIYADDDFHRPELRIRIRIRIQELKLMRIHTDPDPDPKP